MTLFVIEDEISLCRCILMFPRLVPKAEEILVKKAMFVLFLALPSFVLAEKPKPDPADYTIAVHVQTSRIASDCSDVTGGTSICFWISIWM
jgi:hypothetical protein